MAIIKEIKIKDEYVTLGKFLKLADLVSSGGEAKAFLAVNKILINKEEDNRRGRKLYRNDVIEIGTEVYRIC
ncbi:MAG: S4 domain-containing protein YaaA [Erysipelotrichaceae bacterium]|nr:S4 domain-containing protein YaaA [Erysipelotrichaceae bacterium]